MRPLIAITPDIITVTGLPRLVASRAYADVIERTGGEPIVLNVNAEAASRIAARVDGFVLTGGDDPRTEPYGAPTDPRITPVHDDRQAFEHALLVHLAQHRPEAPVLGVCLGMQMMALTAGGALDQYMPDTTPTHTDHWDAEHEIHAEDAAPFDLTGTVRSKHKQAVADAGSLRVTARAHDGTIEAIDDPSRPFYLGVQWHPERTAATKLGDDLFKQLVTAAIHA